MQRFVAVVLVVAISASLVGCGGSASTPAAATSGGNYPPPEAMVAEFLEAVRTGNDEKASALLTPLARQKTSEMNLEVAPPGSDTAKFKVLQVEYIAEDGAHVGSEWTDVDETGASHTDPIVWMVRREENGWRIAGMATNVFENEPPLFLNFEDPDDMMRKQQLVQEEMQRRAAQAGGKTATAPPSNVSEAPAKTKTR